MRSASADPHDELVGSWFEEGPIPRGGVAMFGMPFDGAIIGRPGARGGPDAIRAELRKLKAESLPACVDLGNVAMPRADAVRASDLATAAAEEALDAGAFPVALGGDHSLTFGTVRAAAKARRIAVVNLDAHLDIRDADPREPSSGTPFRRLVDESVLPPEHVIQVGTRIHANARHYLDLARSWGMPILEAREFDVSGPAHVAERVATLAMEDELDGVHVSLDVDVLDESAAPGVSAPTPGGLSTRELFDFLHYLAAEVPILGLDVMEVSPPYDRDAMTARAAAFAIVRVLSSLEGA